MARNTICNARTLDSHATDDVVSIQLDKRIIADILPGPASLTETDGQAWDLRGGWLLPGPLDAQVNGGGGLLFNNDPTPAGLATIVAAHRRLGTAGLLATVITDSAEVRRSAAAAVCDQLRAGLPGLLGIHFEGPFINPAKAGVHDPRHIADAGAAALADIAGLAGQVQAAGGVALMTVAPEKLTAADIAALTAQGVVLAAGHSAASYEQAMAGFAAGIAGVTHLFNAMSPLESRAPGLVGAALDHPDVWCGVIADGFHSHPAALRLAARIKGPDRLVLVSDAMACAGGPPSFELYGQTLRSVGGRLVDAAGRLAGADLCMVEALRNMIRLTGTGLGAASAMTAAAPARALGLAGRGRIARGMVADLLWLDADLTPRGVWAAGEFFPCDAKPLPKTGTNGV